MEDTGVEEAARRSASRSLGGGPHHLTMESFTDIGLPSSPGAGARSSKVGLASFPPAPSSNDVNRSTPSAFELSSPNVAEGDVPRFCGCCSAPWLAGANSFVVRSALLASICSALLGYDIGVTSGALLFVAQDMSLDLVQQEVFVGILNLVSLVGALVAGRLADAFGRRVAMATASGIFAAGSLVMAFALNYPVLIVGRVVTGIGVGFGLAVPPLYIAEISPPSNRGGLVSFGEVFINLGILLGFFTSFMLGGLPPSSAWRWMLGLGVIPALALAGGVVFLCESPRWLIMHGRVKAGEAVLQQTSMDGLEARKRYLEIVEAAGLSEEVGGVGGGVMPGSGMVRPMEGAGGTGVWKELLWPTTPVRRMLIVLIGINFFQQATGIDATVYYSPVMFQQAGLQGNRALLGATLVVGITKVSFVLASMCLLDHFGRRPLLLTSTLGMMVALIAQGLGFLFLEQQGTDAPDSPVFAVVAILANCFFVAFFSIGLGPINWLYTSEIFPLRLRAQAIGLGTAVNRIASGAVAMSFLSIGAATGPAGPFFIFAAMALLATVFFFFRAPETKGKSLEQLVKMFERSDYALHPDRYDGMPGGLASYDGNRATDGGESPDRMVQ